MTEWCGHKNNMAVSVRTEQSLYDTDTPTGLLSHIEAIKEEEVKRMWN